jgi:poly(3-hydroxyalkanoate) synthetase
MISAAMVRSLTSFREDWRFFLRNFEKSALFVAVDRLALSGQPVSGHKVYLPSFFVRGHVRSAPPASFPLFRTLGDLSPGEVVT